MSIKLYYQALWGCNGNVKVGVVIVVAAKWIMCTTTMPKIKLSEKASLAARRLACLFFHWENNKSSHGRKLHCSSSLTIVETFVNYPVWYEICSSSNKEIWRRDLIPAQSCFSMSRQMFSTFMDTPCRITLFLNSMHVPNLSRVKFQLFSPTV